MKTDSAQIQYDKMTKTPVNKLVLQLGLPTTVSMLVTSVYNMADTFFVSQLGTSVSGATGVVFALMAIINAFGFMFGHGAGSNISRKLGAHDVESARKFASTSFFLSLLCGALICILGFLFHAPFMRLLGSTDSILPHAIEYSTWILIAAPAMASSCVMNNILRYEGKAFFAMLGLASGGILNIFGDMFLIFVLKLGVRGAGISTAISQYISMAILISPFLRGKVQSRLNIRYVTRRKWVVYTYRLLVGGMVLFGSLASLDFVWSMADITMGLMAICNLIAISFLGKYAFRLLNDYRSQKRSGIKNPVFTKDKMKDIEKDIECW